MLLSFIYLIVSGYERSGNERGRKLDAELTIQGFCVRTKNEISPMSSVVLHELCGCAYVRGLQLKLELD